MKSNLASLDLSPLLGLNQEIYSRQPFWNQGMGGNVSMKISDSLMAIKPSGYRLDGLNNSSDFAYIDHAEFLSVLHHLGMSGKTLSEKEFLYSEEMERAKQRELSERRPSMEVGFHAALDGKYILHFHHLNSLIFADALQELHTTAFYTKWRDQMKVIPYKRPGWELSSYFIKNKISEKIIIMQNHGVILQLMDPSEFREFLDFDLELRKLLEQHHEIEIHKIEIEILTKSLEGPFRYFYPDVAIFESKLKRFIAEVDSGKFALADRGGGISQDHLENWMAMVYLNRVRPQINAILSSEAESLKQMPAEIARLRQSKSQMGD